MISYNAWFYIQAHLGVRAYPWIVSKKVSVCVSPQVRMGCMHYILFWHFMLQKVCKLMEPLVPQASSHVWYWFLWFGVRNNSFHQPQFDPNSSWLYFCEKVFIYVKERLFLKWYKERKGFFPSHSIWSESVSNNFSEKKNHRRESDGFSRNDPLQQDWVEITRFRFCGSLFSASFFFFFFFAPFLSFWS